MTLVILFTCLLSMYFSIPSRDLSVVFTSVYLSASLVAQMVQNLPAMRETWFDPWVGKIPWRRAWPPTTVF